MPFQVRVFFAGERFPKPDSLQKALHSHGYAIDFISGFDPAWDRGVIPVLFDGQDAAFTYACEPTETVKTLLPLPKDPQDPLRTGIGERDHCATFGWSSKLLDWGAAMATAGCLTRLTDGVLYDAQKRSLLAADRVMTALRAEIDGLLYPYDPAD